VDVASRRELTNKRTVEHGRELFPALTLAGAVAIATIAGGAAAVVGTTVAVVCTLEDCMGCDSVRGWHDSDGSTFNCDWYAEGTNCLVHGEFYSNFGYTAREACCACGGGN
jgi:hypothetical protein